MKQLAGAVVAALALLAASPASATIGATPEASAAFARAQGARHATFYVTKGKVVAEDWLLPAGGWPKARAHEAIRRLTGTKGPFAKRELKGGNEWLTTGAGVAVLGGGPTTEAFTITPPGWSFDAKAHAVMLWLPAYGLRRQGPSPENVALIKPGLTSEVVAALLGPWEAPPGDHHDAGIPSMTWRRGGKPVLRVHFKDEQVVRVEKL